MKKEIQAVLLTIVMVISLLLFVPAFAESNSITYLNRQWDVESKRVVEEEKTVEAYKIDDATGSLNDGNWYYVSGIVEIYGSINVNGNVNLILCDGAKLEVSDGIRVQDNSKLFIYGQKNDTGILNAYATESYAAGIGGYQSNDVGYITINGGTVYATGGDLSAGIGGGDNGAGGTVTINGGIVKAIGNESAAGIGGGDHGEGGSVTINGGTVTAIGANDSAGIGKGNGGSLDGDLTFNTEVMILSGDREPGTVTSIVDYISNREQYVHIESPYNVSVQVQGPTTCSAKVEVGGNIVNKAMKSEEVCFTAMPTDGYVLDHWEVIAGGITLSDDDKVKSPLTVTMPDKNLTLKACFKAIAYNITVGNDGNGTAKAQVNGADVTSATINTSVSLVATPAEGYEFDQWKVISGGVTVTDNQFTIGTANVEIQACFKAVIPEPDTYTVTVTNDGHGTASANPVSGTTNTLVKLTATPAEGYEFDQWKVISGGVTVTDNQFTIGTANVEIQACFKAVIPEPETYTVTVTNDGHGTASANPVSGTTNTLVKLTATPAEGYEFDQWKVIGGGVTVTDNQFTIGTANVEIQACFKKKVDPKPEYKIIKGDGQTIFTNATSAVFSSSAPFDKFSHVLLDGEKLAKKYYKAESGSTVITLNEKYIRKLSVGKHKLTIVSNDGSVTAKFTVEKDLPETGDSTNLALLLTLLIACTGTIILVTAKAKKRS